MEELLFITEKASLREHIVDNVEELLRACHGNDRLSSVEFLNPPAGRNDLMAGYYVQPVCGYSFRRKHEAPGMKEKWAEGVGHEHI